MHLDRVTYPQVKDRLWKELSTEPPARISGEPVARSVTLVTNDGFKWWTPDGSWLLIRFSGTEPLVRVYVEATSEAKRDAMLGAGERLVRGAA